MIDFANQQVQVQAKFEAYYRAANGTKVALPVTPSSWNFTQNLPDHEIDLTFDTTCAAKAGATAIFAATATATTPGGKTTKQTSKFHSQPLIGCACRGIGTTSRGVGHPLGPPRTCRRLMRVPPGELVCAAVRRG